MRLRALLLAELCFFQRMVSTVVSPSLFHEDFSFMIILNNFLFIISDYLTLFLIIFFLFCQLKKNIQQINWLTMKQLGRNGLFQPTTQGGMTFGHRNDDAEVGDICRCFSIQDFVHQAAAFELHCLCDTQPVQIIPKK